MKIIEQKAEYKWCTPNIAEAIEFGCRTCYKSHNLSKDGSAERLFNQVVKQSHHDSVSEHGSVTFQLTTDRAVLAQLTRHRIGTGFSVESQRYCNYSKGKFDGNVTFIVPEGLGKDSLAYDIWFDSMLCAEQGYMDLLQQGVKPEVARSVLPNSTKVELTFTANIRALRHLFSLRMSNHAQADIKKLCNLMYDAMIQSGEVPAFLFDDIVQGE
jgi:thymidylate synthase (FAD)